MSTKSRPTIGAFLDVLADSYHQRYWSGLVEGSIKHNINLLCFSDVYYPQQKNYTAHIKEMINLANNSEIDAIINWASTLTWIVTRDNFPVFFQNIKNNPDYLKLQSIPEDIPITVMGSYLGFKEVLLHFIKVHGYRKIAFIRGPENHLGALERYRAYVDTLKDNDIPYDENIVTPFPDPFNPWKEETGEKMMNYLIEKRKKYHFEAVICTSDTLGYGALNALKKAGIKVPSDIAVAGFDDYPLSKFKAPSLTTVNPQFEEVGRVSIEAFVNLLNGDNVPKKQIVLPKLMIRESCGCIDPVIIQAAYSSDINITDKNNSIDDLSKIKEEIKNDILTCFHGIISNEKAEEMIEAFLKEIEKVQNKSFLPVFDELFQIFTASGEDLFLINQVISIFRKHILSSIKNSEIILKCENLLHQVRILTGDHLFRQQGIKMFYEKEENTLLEKIEEELISTFNINKLMDILSEKLPAAGIPSCYLSLYEDNKPPYEWSRLMLAYNNEKRIKIEDEGVRFLTTDLAPNGIISDLKSIRFVIKPLFFHNEQLGFVLFESGTLNGAIYEKLKTDISSAVKGAILVKEMEKRTAELDKAYHDLKENQKKLLSVEKMASLGRLTAGIAHEMNTPLAVVRSSMKELVMLIDEYKLSIHNNSVLPEDHESIASDMLRHAEIAAKAAEKSAGFIRGIKGQTFSNNQNIVQTFQATQIIIDTLNLLEFRIKKSSSKIISEFDDTIYLNGNQLWLSQIITNLVNNAIDACIGKECIISVKLSKINDKNAQLTVQDTGSGISPENISKIFDPLFTTKPFGEATGLGLSIVSELVNQFKGSIEVKSETGLTIFTILFPLQNK